MEVKLNKATENPFYGMSNTLSLYQLAAKGSITYAILDKCWSEVGNDRVRKEMFFSLLFSVGDITARQHNLFRGNKVDSGGHSMRENFRVIMQWMKTNHKAQYYKFMYAHLFNEYTTFDNLLAARVKTKKKTSNVTEIVDMLGSASEMKDLAEYLASIIKGKSTFDKYLVAKFLTRPRLSKRQGHKKLLPQTKELMSKKAILIKMVSDLCDFPYEQKQGYINFKGYYEWRKPFIGNMESVIFSSNEISKFDEEEFVHWLDKIPATARLRVRNRVLDKNQPKPRWGEMGNWFLKWERFKEEKQGEQRVLEEKVRQGDTSEETAAKLQQVKKEAKVTVGANNFADMFSDIVKGTVDTVKIQPFLDKVMLPYNSLVFVDDSGSMTANAHPKYRFTAFDFAAFMATICLMKNPSDVGRSMMGLFSRDTRIIRYIEAVSTAPNSLLQGATKNVKLPLYEPKINFMENLSNMRAMLRANQTYNMTSISSIPERLHSWSEGDDAKIELLREFPVWTIITDGNFNNLPSPEGSMNDFMRRCINYFGFKPFVLAIDVSDRSQSANIQRFSGIENFMYIPPNPAQIEQLLTNFRDMDVMDVYTPLQSLHRSSRYAPVRNAVI